MKMSNNEHIRKCRRIVAAIFLVIVGVIVSDGALAYPGKFEKYAEQYKPIRECVCGGKATKEQMASLVKCMDEFKASFKHKQPKVSKMV